MTDVHLQSPAFEDGGEIPRKYGYTHDNVNPPLEIDGVPPETGSLVLLVDSPDPESSGVWNHWLVWDIPPSQTEIPEGWDAAEATEGQNDFGEHGYGGPNPVGQRQTYRFRLYAIETTLDLPAGTDKEELTDAILGQILAKAELDGTYTK